MPSAAPDKRRIIGIDPGLAAAGWGIIDVFPSRIIHIAHGRIATSPCLPRSERLLLIHETLCSILDKYEPTEASMETLYFAKNVSSAFPVAEARGVLAMSLAKYSIPLRDYSPKAIKQAVVGRGAAGKAQVQELVCLLLGLSELPRPNHAADALGAAICRAHDIDRLIV